MKILLWFFGVALSAIPLVAAIVVLPSSFPDILAFSSYISFFPELVFMCVAIGAMAIAESIELLIDLDPVLETGKIAITTLCLVVLLIIIIISGVWYGRFISDPAKYAAISVSDIRVIMFMLGGVLFGAFVLKLLLWART